MFAPTSLTLSGERFRVRYALTGDETEARSKAEALCLEQTVELPAELLPDDDVRGQIVGQIETLKVLPEGRCDVVISYAVETVGAELPQLLNVLFGNSSLKPGIRVMSLDLPEGLLRQFPGPRFGQAGWRSLLDAPERPLLCTALKPMGSSPRRLADLAYQLATGGIDMIKDDHGLANQPFCPYHERVARCAEAVARANSETGLNCVYMPHVSAPAEKIVERALFAKQAGAGALLIAPGLVGFDVMRQLAADDRIALPIMYHPALHGTYVTRPDQGISHAVLFGQLPRLAGADATIYPNYGGRFAFSKEECRQIVEAAAAPMGGFQPIFPVVAGGMTLERVPELLDFYGHDVIFLIGGDLYRHSPDLVENCRYFRSILD